MRHKKLKQFIALVLASVLTLGSSISTLAVNPGVPSTSPGKGGPAGKAGTPQNGWGHHVTIACMGDINPDIRTIELQNINNEVLNDLEMEIQLPFHQRYLRPGEGGIIFCTPDAMAFPFAPVSSDNYNDIRPVTKYPLKNSAGTPPSHRDVVDWNILGWQIYKTIQGPGDRPGQNTDDGLGSSIPMYAFNEELWALFTSDGAAAVGDAVSWINQVQQVYTAAAPGYDAYTVLSNIITMPSTLHNNVTLFDWSAWAGDFAGATNLERCVWDRIGLASFCAYLCMLAEDGSIERSDWSNTLYNWVSNGYKGQDMPVIDIQMGAPMALNWSASGVSSQVLFATTPYVYEHCVPGVSAEMLYSGWGGTAHQENIHDRIGKAFGLNNVPLPYRAYTAQAFGLVGWVNGVPRRNWGDMNQLGRHWCTQLEAIGNTGLEGYYPIYTYPVSGDPDVPEKDPMGSFTWDLTPKGLIDKTPAKEISESSTIYNLNVSQNGYNQNNYSSKWEPLVASDNSDCNQIQIDVYHISQKLPEGTEATLYERNQVKSGGKPVMTAVDKVTVGTGIIQNVPSIGTLEAGKKTQVTDAQLLDILKTGTGLTYTETVAGPLVINDNPEGVRVTYAVYVTVWTGCRRQFPFTNDQQWYVEYRSEPGTYIYESDDPQGFAEIKCGYFDRDRGYEEPYEAMAGSPTTENLYFVSGGQEFVAQI
ncbi:MAG: hypothetical protein NC131_21180, partial [Roseburia sp.]|nr:hypothetical protein [Roseburia sp.]